MKAIIILPTYNEAQNVEAMIKKLFEEVFTPDTISVLIVDSNSLDGTADIVEQNKAKYKNLFLIRQNEKKGLASAYIDGFKWALTNEFDIFVQMDCDFQHPPEILPNCFEKIKDYDVIIASRYVGNGKWCNDSKYGRSTMSELGNLYVRAVLNCPIKDMTGGYSIWTRKALETINCDSIIARGYLFQVEMKYRAYKNQLKFYEYPFVFETRRAGESKINKKIILEALLKVWELRNIH